MHTSEIQSWVQQRIPAPFATHLPEIRAYDDEVLVILRSDQAMSSDTPEQTQIAELKQIEQQRENTRKVRMRMADELQAMLKRPIAWGMRIGKSEVIFTTRSVPVMTRLGRPERELLDTLVAAGVAETRSSALAYIVRAFATEHAEWLAEVREAIAQVEEVRAKLQITSRPGAPLGTSVRAVPEGDAHTT